MVDTAWTFTVLFMVIFVVIIVFAVLWLMSQRASSTVEDLPSSPLLQEILDPGLARGEVSPDEHDEILDELDGGSASSSGGRPAELVHR